MINQYELLVLLPTTRMMKGGGGLIVLMRSTLKQLMLSLVVQTSHDFSFWWFVLNFISET